MRVTVTLLFFFLFTGVYAQERASCAGLYAQLNTSLLAVTSSPVKHSGSIRSVSQWSAGGGAYWISRPHNRIQFELQLGYESTGSGREVYFNSGNSLTRVYDRYRTISTVAMITMQLPFALRWHIGGGLKSNVVINHQVRNEAIMTSPPNLVIISPAVKRAMLSGIAELVVTFPKGEIGVQGWYAFTPLIYDNNTLVKATGASLTVKAYIW